jgi:ribosomal protein S18 acetylase RimI-like enzyme
MKFKEYLREALTFQDEMVGSQSGQKDLRLTAYMNDEVVGWIDYSDFRNEISIKYIEVKQKYRRKGIGKKLLLELQRLYPKTEIQLGMLTGDGAMLVKSVKLYVDKTRIKKLEQLEKEMENLKKEEKQLVKKLKAGSYKKNDVIGNRLNDINDRMYEIEEELTELR